MPAWRRRAVKSAATVGAALRFGRRLLGRRGRRHGWGRRRPLRGIGRSRAALGRRSSGHGTGGGSWLVGVTPGHCVRGRAAPRDRGADRRRAARSGRIVSTTLSSFTTPPSDEVEVEEDAEEEPAEEPAERPAALHYGPLHADDERHVDHGEHREHERRDQGRVLQLRARDLDLHRAGAHDVAPLGVVAEERELRADQDRRASRSGRCPGSRTGSTGRPSSRSPTTTLPNGGGSLRYTLPSMLRLPPPVSDRALPVHIALTRDYRRRLARRCRSCR